MYKSMNGDIIRVSIWRRGRGIINWMFRYVDYTGIVNTPSWYTTPGYYYEAVKNVYRLTIDHDFPNKPMWLGYRKAGVWVNAEGLYDVLFVSHNRFTLTGRDLHGAPHRSDNRRKKSADFIIESNERVTKASVEGFDGVYA
jgi:hypothetical protein